MATCKECLHEDVCAYKVKGLHTCDSFKDKTKYVEQKYARWIYDKNYTGKNKDVWICSKCGNRCALRKKQPDSKGMSNEEIMREHKKWCNNCGARNKC